MRRTMQLAVAAAALGASAPAVAGLADITAASDPVLYWNERATTIYQTGAPPQSRAYAIMNIAMHDAVNAAIGKPNKSYLGDIGASGGSGKAAAIQAAHDVMVALNPANAAQYALALEASLAEIPDGARKTRGRATGAAAAVAALASRAADGSTPPGTYATTGLPGDWRPTGPGAAAVPHWGGVAPFLLASGDQFRPGPPPALGSAEYLAAYNEVKDVVDEIRGDPEDDRHKSALFWDQANAAPWLRIGLTVAEDEDRSTIEFARAFALLSTGLADALIAGFDAKYTYRLWRPVTAITTDDGIEGTEQDAAWTSLFPAPLHPSYISTHSALSGAGSTILAALFGDDEAFELTIAEATRPFDGLEDAALDGANSRLWGGIHFSFDNAAGLELGRAIGRYGLAGEAFDRVPAPPALALLGLGAATLLARRRRRG